MTAQLSLLDVTSIPTGEWVDYGPPKYGGATVLSYRRLFVGSVHQVAFPNANLWRGIGADADCYQDPKRDEYVVRAHADRFDHPNLQWGKHRKVVGLDAAKASLRELVAEAEAWVARSLADVVAERIALLESQLAIADEADTYEAAQTRRRLAAEIADMRGIR